MVVKVVVVVVGGVVLSSIDICNNDSEREITLYHLSHSSPLTLSFSLLHLSIYTGAYSGFAFRGG